MTQAIQWLFGSCYGVLLSSVAHRRREAEKLAREAHDAGVAIDGVHAGRRKACSPQRWQRAAADAQANGPMPLQAAVPSGVTYLRA